MTSEHFVKIATRPGELPTLSIDRILRNGQAGIVTSLLLDTNVMLSISNYVEACSKSPTEFDILLDRYSLRNFVDLLKSLTNFQFPMSISPGFTFPEVLSDDFEAVISNYNEFFDIIRVPMSDDSGGLIPFPMNNPHDILELDETQIAMRAFSYISLGCLLLCLSDYAEADPFRLYSKYLDLLDEYVGIYSDKENILAICAFLVRASRIPNGDLLPLITRGVANFTTLASTKSVPQNSDEVKRLAFNGSSDLFMIVAAMTTSEVSIDNVNYDTWFVTQDKKLAEFFTKVFHYVVLFQGGEGATPAPLPEELVDLADPFMKTYYSRKAKRPMLEVREGTFWTERIRRFHDLVDQRWKTKV